MYSLPPSKLGEHGSGPSYVTYCGNSLIKFSRKTTHLLYWFVCSAILQSDIYFLVYQIKDEVSGQYGTYACEEKCIQYFGRETKERGNLEGLGIDERKIKWFLIMWLMMGTVGGLLCTR